MIQTIDIILEKIKSEEISVAKVSKETGIPDQRIYKWKSGKGKPKSEDVQKLLNWHLEQVPKVEEKADNALMALIETNKALAVAQVTEAETKQMLAKTNDRLVQMVATAGEFGQTSTAFASTVAGLLAVIAEIGTGKTWHSKKEALAELSTLVPVGEKKDVKKGIHADSGKSGR